MPAFFHNNVLDAGLQVIDDATALYICTGTPTDRATVLSQALATTAVTSADFSIGAGSPDGRALVVAAKSGVSVTATGTPAHYCLVDGTRLLARTEVNPASPNLTTGSQVDIPSVPFTIGAPTVVS